MKNVLLLGSLSVPIFDYSPPGWWPVHTSQSCGSSAAWRTELVGRGWAWKPPGCFSLCSGSCNSVVSRDVPLSARAPQEEELRAFCSGFHYIEFHFLASALRLSDWSFLAFFLIDLKKTNFTVTPFIAF